MTRWTRSKRPAKARPRRRRAHARARVAKVPPARPAAAAAEVALELATPMYSPHFSRAELSFSETAARRSIDNTPPAAVEPNLVRLCDEVLEPMRARFGALAITSGYRCRAVNTAIGGSRTSAHLDGRAADTKPVDPAVRLVDVVAWLQGAGLPIDQVIYEFASWVHVGIATPGAAPRGQALMIFEAGRYLPFDPAGIPPGSVR